MQTNFSSIIPLKLKELANSCPFPLYVVGGSVRDFLLDLTNANPDWDICAPVSAEVFLNSTGENFKKKSVFKNTGTVKFEDDDGAAYEFTSFRSDKYVRGFHSPSEIFFTTDITLDAKRRDFTANAIYYDIKNDEFLDPLDGIAAVQNRRLTTVDDAAKVFGEDGLRLMRLCRQAAQLNLTPDDECISGARENAALILDIHPQRIFSELSSILTADTKHGAANGHYNGLKLLDKTGVLDYILPEISAGRNLAQRADFHSHDVMEHTFRCVKYIEPDITLRLAALFHDVGKPVCLKTQSNCHNHETIGAAMTKQILSRLAAPQKLTERVTRLVQEHMYDMKSAVRENKLKKYIVQNYDLIFDLMKLKQADYSACKDDLNECPTNKRWHVVLEQLKKDNAPLKVKDLDVNGLQLIDIGIPKDKISKVLNELLFECVVNPSLNTNKRLLKLSFGALATVNNQTQFNETLIRQGENNE